MAGEQQSGRIPPQDLEAERSVLGAMLLDNNAIHRAVESVLPEDFYREANAHIYEAILALYQRNEPADLVTVTNELKTKGILDRVGGAGYLAEIVDQVPTSANVVSHGRI